MNIQFQEYFLPTQGDLVEFLSDRQTEKGPSSGYVALAGGRYCYIRHSDTLEKFDVEAVEVEELTTTARDGRRLWRLR